MSKRGPRKLSSPELDRLAAILASKREKKGISQRKLSKAIGIWEFGVMEIERGGRDLYITELIAIADILGEDPVALLAEALQPPQP